MAKILLVDDEPRIARVVRDMVEGADWQFAYADNGADALDAVARETPDLIIMAVMMPKMDGFTACRELRARGVTVPVIFLSAKGDIVDKGVGFAAGGDDYMVKPFDPRKTIIEYMVEDQPDEPLASLSVRQGGEVLGSRTAAPGGGSASSLVSSMGIGRRRGGEEAKRSGSHGGMDDLRNPQVRTPRHADARAHQEPRRAHAGDDPHD